MKYGPSETDLQLFIIFGVAVILAIMSSKTTQMKGAFLFIYGLFVVLVALCFDMSAPGTTIVNFGSAIDRVCLILTGVALTTSGAIFYATGKLLARFPNDQQSPIGGRGRWR